MAIIWGTAFVAQRVVAKNLNVYLFNGSRFLLGALVLAPLLYAKRKTSCFQAKYCLATILAGMLLFVGASLQQYGLRWTTAANAGFITGLYVVFIPLILALFLRQSPKPVVWIAVLLAATGLFLLSTKGSLIINTGDSYELIGAVFWALHVILIGWLAKRIDILALAIIQYTVCGVLSLTFGKLLDNYSFIELANMGWAVLYTGLFSIGVGYTLQAVGQRVAPPADAAILLSSEALFAAIAGWLLLSEKLAGIQLFGCGLMLVGILLIQVYPLRKGKWFSIK